MRVLAFVEKKLYTSRTKLRVVENVRRGLLMAEKKF